MFGRRFREVTEIKSSEIEKINFEKRLAELDKPMFDEVNEIEAKRALDEKFKELNRKMLEELMLEELDKPFD